MPLVKSGKLKVLAITSAKPSTLFPDLPSVAATVPGYEMTSTYCVFAPAKTPSAIINLLSREIVRVLRSPEAKEQIDQNGFEIIAGTPQELAAVREADIARVRKLINDAGLPIGN
jgi:tripartite-type tricarboxylate transporter receptor subunit TctC